MWVVITTVLLHYLASFLSVCLPWIFGFLVLHAATACDDISSALLLLGSIQAARLQGEKTSFPCPSPFTSHRRPRLKCSLSLWVCPRHCSIRWGLLEKCILAIIGTRTRVLGTDHRRHLQRVLGLLCQIYF